MKEPKRILLHVLRPERELEEITAALYAAKEYYDGFNLGYDTIDVAIEYFRYDVSQLDPSFKGVDYINGMENAYDYFMYIGFPPTVQKIFKDKFEKYIMNYSVDDNRYIESLADRYISDYAFEADYPKNETQIMSYMDRYLEDLKKYLSEDNKDVVREIKKGLNKLRKRLCQE